MRINIFLNLSHFIKRVRNVLPFVTRHILTELGLSGQLSRLYMYSSEGDSELGTNFHEVFFLQYVPDNFLVRQL